MFLYLIQKPNLRASFSYMHPYKYSANTLFSQPANMHRLLLDQQRAGALSTENWTHQCESIASLLSFVLFGAKCHRPVGLVNMNMLLAVYLCHSEGFLPFGINKSVTISLSAIWCSQLQKLPLRSMMRSLQDSNTVYIYIHIFSASFSVVVVHTHTHT